MQEGEVMVMPTATGYHVMRGVEVVEESGAKFDTVKSVAGPYETREKAEEVAADLRAMWAAGERELARPNN